MQQSDKSQIDLNIKTDDDRYLSNNLFRFCFYCICRYRQDKAKRADIERAEKERAEKERAEKERADIERAEKERADIERADIERAEKERAEKERAEKERAEKERAEKERAEKERADIERAENERVEIEDAYKTLELDIIPKDGISVRFQLPDGRKLVRIFLGTDLIKKLLVYVKYNYMKTYKDRLQFKFSLKTNSPIVELNDMTKNINEISKEKRFIIFVIDLDA